MKKQNTESYLDVMRKFHSEKSVFYGAVVSDRHKRKKSFQALVRALHGLVLESNDVEFSCAMHNEGDEALSYSENGRLVREPLQKPKEVVLYVSFS
jgi:hypothetical protein